MCGGVGLGGEYSVVKGIAILIELEVNLIVMVVAVPYGQVLEWNQNYDLGVWFQKFISSFPGRPPTESSLPKGHPQVNTNCVSSQVFRRNPKYFYNALL